MQSGALPCDDISTTVTLIQSARLTVPVRVAVNSTTPAPSVTVRLDSLRQYMVATGETEQKTKMVKAMVQVLLAGMLKKHVVYIQSYTKLAVHTTAIN